MAAADRPSREHRPAGAIALTLALALTAAPCFAASMEEAREAARARDFKRTAEILTPLAESGNVEAQLKLAGLFRAGRGVAKSHTKAVRWLEEAAEAGNADAQYQLGVMHENGWGTDENLAEARKWFTAAEKQGHSLAREKLARINQAPIHTADQNLFVSASAGKVDEIAALLSRGASVSARDASGRTAFFLAAINHRFEAASRLLEAGSDIDAQDNQGDTALIHLTREGHGEGVSRLLALGADARIENQRAENARQLAKASDNPPLHSLFLTTESLEEAQEATRRGDFKRTAQILTPLAKAGNIEAQVTLAGLYRAGRGVSRDHAKAVHWLKEAAEAGDADA